MTKLIERYSHQVASLRLIARGMSPELIQTVSIEEVDVASKQQRAAAGLSFIPLYIMMAAFVSGMGIAIDTTAGERERKSLEPLLINPVERFQIVTGKWLAASLFSTIGLVLTAVLCIVAMLQAPLEEIGLGFTVSPLQLTAMILGTAPLASSPPACNSFWVCSRSHSRMRRAIWAFS
ncbi:MAG: ABC transporter permease subunit [Gammaproteobacteria bacterium]|nr:ABC transporter permease subunit [Gammaproteobacteria bacterium]